MLRAGVFALERWKMNNQKEYCHNCGSRLSFKFHRFPVGFICNRCYLSADKYDIFKWSEYKEGGKNVRNKTR